MLICHPIYLSLVKYLFRFFAPFKTGLCVTLPVRYKFLNIFWIQILNPIIWFATIFSKSVACLLSFQTVLFEAQDFNFDEVHFNFFKIDYAFVSVSKKSLPNPRW